MAHNVFRRVEWIFLSQDIGDSFLDRVIVKILGIGKVIITCYPVEERRNGASNRVLGVVRRGNGIAA